MKALIIGATGLVGTQLVTQLINQFKYTEIVIFVRKKLPLQHVKLTQIIIDFNQIENYKHLINGDVLFSCLGTTIKKAKTKKNQYLIDYTYQLKFAEIAAFNKVKQYILISSLGANKNATNFYSKMKGDLEETIKQLDFKNIYIIQPSLLLGKRNEFRFGEKIGMFLFKIFNFMIPDKYKGIYDYKVANSMINCSLKINHQKINIISNKMMIQKKV